jgi:hypothetical protein
MKFLAGLGTRRSKWSSHYQIEVCSLVTYEDREDQSSVEEFANESNFTRFFVWRGG